ncbi:alkaline phosphatase family protein [Bacillus sp. AK031]
MMNKRLFLIITFLALSLGYAGSSQYSSEDDKIPLPMQTSSHVTSKVIVLVIDSLMDKPLKKAIGDGEAPALEFFMNRGQYSNNLVSSYPTMSVTIDSSILTGAYPDEHKIPGLVWFNDKEKQIITYGNGVFEILKLGLSDFAKNGLYEFNNIDLSREVTTIHEDLDKAGLKTASINALVYRGNYPHTLKVPKIISKLSNLPEELETMGPEKLSLGLFSRQNLDNDHTLNRIGLNDTFAAEEMIHLLKNNSLPPFTIMYFPENDHAAHKKGPTATNGIEEADKQLQKILNGFQEWDEALVNTVWVIMSDSNQSLVINDKKEALIDLRKSFSKYKVLQLGKDVSGKDEIVITANERMAYIYSLKEHLRLQQLARNLQPDSRIAWIAWKDGEKIRVVSPDHEGDFTFSPGGSYEDQYTQRWSINGNREILDLSIKQDQIVYGNYPDALARLYGATQSQQGEFLIADAKPGYEFIGESSPQHTGGGAHGSMHKVDSSVPIIVAGTNKSIENLRIVDLKDWILDVLRK